MLWWRNRHNASESAAVEVQKTEHQIAQIDAQDTEVTARVRRLTQRQMRNHFASSMYAAMGMNLDEEP